MRHRPSQTAEMRKNANQDVPGSMHVPGAELSPEEQQQALAHRVTRQCMQTLADAFSTGPGVEPLSRAVQSMYTDMEQRLGQVDFQPPMACARGCSYCCYNQISLTPPEALFLGLYMFERYQGEQVLALAARVDNILARIKGRTRAELGAMRHELPCPFLEDGACGVHPARPLACRGWNAVDVRQCRAANESANPMTMIENHALPRVLADAVQLGLLQGSKACGMEAGFLVITRAVKLLLEHGVAECARGWLAGEAFFGRGHSW